MELSAVAIDDEPLALEIIRNFAASISDIRLDAVFDNAMEGLRYLRAADPDLLFIDIDMPDINGTSVIRQLAHPPMVIFTTAYKEFALEGFELEAIDYLLKPFSAERFEKAVNKALRQGRRAGPAADEFILVHSEYRMLKIAISEILYIESLDDYIKIHLKQGKPVLTLLSLKKIQEQLPEDRFMRIHRSYIVAFTAITMITGRKITLSNAVALPVSERYMSDLNQRLGKT
ncbi:LytTR family DNA-binding domain-containing protein [Niabella terrae]